MDNNKINKMIEEYVGYVYGCDSYRDQQRVDAETRLPAAQLQEIDASAKRSKIAIWISVAALIASIIVLFVKK